jgi:hypothetical protein
MATRALKGSINVEWVNVTYRSVWVTVIVLTLGLAATGYWYWSRHMIPQDEAQIAIDQAANRFAEATALPADESVAEILDNAKVQLEVARAEFAQSAYSKARIAAMRSEKLSLRVISIGDGEEAPLRQVQFSKIEGDVRVKRAGSFSWKSANTKMILRVGDQVKTSSSGSAEVLYFDGTVTRVEPGSLLEIRDLYEDPVTKVRRVREKLTWGEVKASTQQRNVSGSFHEVSTDKVSARAEEEGEFRIAYDKQEQTSVVDVFGGRIELATDSRKATVEAGERMRATAEGRLSAKEALPGVPRLLLPSDQRVFVFEEPASEKSPSAGRNCPASTSTGSSSRTSRCSPRRFTTPSGMGRRRSSKACRRGPTTGRSLRSPRRERSGRSAPHAAFASHPSASGTARTTSLPSCRSRSSCRSARWSLSTARPIRTPSSGSTTIRSTFTKTAASMPWSSCAARG